MPPTRGPRLVLLAGILAGVANTVLFPLRNPEQVALASDVYYHAARAAIRGADIYAVNPVGEAGFRYPPLVVAAFLPHGLLGDAALAFALQTLLNLAAVAALAFLVVRAVERGGVDPSRTDRVLLVAFVCLVGPVGVNLVMGQVNPLLAVGIAGGAVLAERDREWASGALFGLVALVKLFPALVGVWLLRRRAWRAVAAATATGLLGLAVGLLVFGVGTTETYVTSTLASEASAGAFAAGADHTAPHATVRRQVAFLAPGLPSSSLLAVSAVVLAPVYAGVNRVVADTRSRLVALLGTLLATLVFLPLEPFYVVLALFPLVPLLYLLDPGTPRTLLLAGALLLLVPVTWPSATTATALLPAGVAGSVESAASTAFAFVLPPTVGTYLALAGCLLFQHRAAAEQPNGFA